jgi:hypothetical protein
MRLSEAKSVGKKIIFVAFCLMLFLVFTALSYGDIDPKYKVRGHPDQELLSPPHGDRFDDVLLLVIPNWNGLCFIVYTKNSSPKDNPTLQNSLLQEMKSETRNGKKAK